MIDLHATGRRGAVCAPNALAVESGRAVLAEGGNAVEAVLATAATSAVTFPHMNAIGGDGFWLIRDRSGRVRYVEACGFAGARATCDLYRGLGHDVIPPRGPLAALTVPGAVGGWIVAHELARAFGGRLPIDRLLADAVRHARDGFASSAAEGRVSDAKLAQLRAVPGFAETYLAEGKAPPAGTRRRFPRLADTLEHLARAGLDDFYHGDVGRELAADLDRLGSPVTRGDLDRFGAVLREPLALKLAQGTIYNAPFPTQGLASLLLLGLYERLRIAAPETTAYVHGLVEATKRAYLIRDRVVTDFERQTISPDRFLDPTVLTAEAAKIDPSRALPWPQPHRDGDTIWLGAADADGCVVSYIQSVFWDYGSGLVAPSTGILMQNRGTSFSLDPKAVNPLEPGRRPFHTLNPAMAVLADGRVMAYGTMGGDGQPQTQAMVFTRHVVHRVPLAEALDRPRWVLGRVWGTPTTNLRLESRWPDAVVEALMRAGHAVERLDQPYADVMGHAGAAILHPDGRTEAGHDPRADGGAAAI